jgi:hypothetical protein
MISAIKPLLIDSEQLLNFIATKDFSNAAVRDGFLHGKSRNAEKLAKLQHRLRDSCEDFGESDDLFPVDSKATVRKIIGEEIWERVSGSKWRPDAVFQLANLAILAAALLDASAQSSEEYGFLHLMWEQFPSPYLYGAREHNDGGLSEGYSTLRQETFEVGLEIRTQYAISLMVERRMDPNFDPVDVVIEVFYLDGDGENTQLLGFPAEGLSTGEKSLPEDFEQETTQRIQAIQEHISDELPTSIDIDALRAAFPWEATLPQTLRWVRARAAELNAQLAGHGGIDQMLRSLQARINTAGMQDRDNVREDDPQEPIASHPASETPRNNASPHGPEPSRSRGKSPKSNRKSLGDQAKRLMQLRAEREKGSRVISNAKPRPAPATAALSDANPFGEDDPVPPPSSSLVQLMQDPAIEKSIVGKVVRTLEKQSRQSNKENIDITLRQKAFVDPQRNAQRLTWDDDEPGTSSSTQRKQPSTRKRPRSAMDDSNEEEENDFENRSAAGANNRREQLRDKTNQRTHLQPSPAKRPRYEVPESVQSVHEANDESEHDPESDQEPSSRQHGNIRWSSSPVQRRRGASSQPPRPLLNSRGSGNPTPSSSAPPAPSQHVQHAREIARQNVARAKPRGVQSRAAWSDAEESRLIELIEEHGPSYAWIKKLDELHPDGKLLDNRNQVQLKDKAQEIKFQLLKYVFLSREIMTHVLAG